MSKIYGDNAMLFELLESMTAELASKDNPDAGFSSVAEVFQKCVGFRLLTISSVLKSQATTQRLWSSDPARFPVGGTKPLDGGGEWDRIVMQQHQSVICNLPSELRRFFFDHSTITSAGCGSGINLPVVLRGEVIGTVNIFHKEFWFTPDRVSQAMALLAFVYAPMLIARQLNE